MSQSSEASPLGPELGSNSSQSRPVLASNGHTEAEPSAAGQNPRFGDIIENGWASEGNPTRTGYFVREGRRTGKLNRGRYYEVTDGKGKFWELPVDRESKITVRAAPPAESRVDDGGDGVPVHSSLPPALLISRLQHSLSLAVEALGPFAARAFYYDHGVKQVVGPEPKPADFRRAREVHSSLTGGE